MSKEINAKKVRNFIEGNLNFYKTKIFGQPEHLMEQYLYRISLCIDDCIPNKECKHCGCNTLKKMWASFPDECPYPAFMAGAEWRKYKENNNIDLEKIKTEIKDVLQ